MRQDTGVDGDAQRISQLCWMFFLKIIDDQDQELELLDPAYRSPIPKRHQWRTWAADPEGITGEELLNFVNTELFPALKNLSVSTKPNDRRRVVKDVFEDAYNYMKSGQLMRQVTNKINSIDFNDLTERQHFGDIYEQILNDLQSAGNAGEYYTPRAVTAFMVDRIDPHPGEILFDPACGTGGFLTCALRHMRERYVKKPEHEQKMQSALRAVEKKQLPHMLCVTNMLLHGVEDPSFVRHDNTLARPYISWEQKDRVDIVLTNPPFGGREEDGIESNFPQHFRTKETADLFLALIIRLLKAGGRAAVVLPDGSLFGEGVKTRLKELLLEECNLHTIVRLPNSVFKPYASIGTNLLFFEKGGPTKDIWFYEHRVPDGQKAYSMTRPIRLEHMQDCIDWWGGTKRQAREATTQAWKVTAGDVKARGYNLDIKNPHTVADDHGDPAVLLGRLDTAEAETATLRGQLKRILAEGSRSMNETRLLAHYERIAGAPDAIARLRRFILDLAVRGKLVPQNPKDEPASILINRISAEKARLVKAGKIRNFVPATTVENDQSEFHLPIGWEWARLGDILTKLTDGTHHSPPNETLGDFRYITAKNIKDDGVSLTDVTYVSRKVHEEIFSRCNPEKGDILYIKDGATTGVVTVNDLEEPFSMLSSVALLKLPRCLFNRLIVIFLRSPFFYDQMRGFMKGAAIPRVTLKRMAPALIPLPPLTEQHRIVARVDELMALCDQLEASLSDTAATRRRLLDALLAEALAPVGVPVVAIAA
jgi:type I restriction enzyme M protein